MKCDFPKGHNKYIPWPTLKMESCSVDWLPYHQWRHWRLSIGHPSMPSVLIRQSTGRPFTLSQYKTKIKGKSWWPKTLWHLVTPKKVNDESSNQQYTHPAIHSSNKPWSQLLSRLRPLPRSAASSSQLRPPLCPAWLTLPACRSGAVGLARKWWEIMLTLLILVIETSFEFWFHTKFYEK